MKKNITRFNEITKELAINTDIAIKKGRYALKKPLENNDGWGRDEIIAVAIAFIIAAFVVVPGLRTFAETVMAKVNSWYNGSIESRIFDTTP